MFPRRRNDDLDGLGLFDEARPRERAFARSLLTALVVDEGVVLWRAGEIGRDFAIISQGHVGVSSASGEYLGVLGPGDVVGELALLGARWRRSTVTTLSRALLYVGGAREFQGLLELVPSLRERVVQRALARIGT